MPSAPKRKIALTVCAAAGIVVTLATFNVAGWAVTWEKSLPLALLFCGIAFFCEFLGFNLAIAAEQQLAEGRRDRFAACVYSLIVCAAVNLVSGHNAWTEFERMMLAPMVAQEQAAIDRERGAVLDQIVVLDRQLDLARPAPDAILGPQARAEAREVYQIEVARLQPRRERLQSRLDAMPVVAENRHIIAPWAVWLCFGLIEVMKALVLWGVGVSLPDLGASIRRRMLGPALAVQDMAEMPSPIEPAPLADDRTPPHEPEPLVLESKNGRALLDHLVKSNVVTMTDVASKHAARPRPGRRKIKEAA